MNEKLALNLSCIILGLLKIGDCIIEVNNEDVGHMTLEDLQDLLVSKPR